MARAEVTRAGEGPDRDERRRARPKNAPRRRPAGDFLKLASVSAPAAAIAAAVGAEAAADEAEAPTGHGLRKTAHIRRLFRHRPVLTPADDGPSTGPGEGEEC